MNALYTYCVYILITDRVFFFFLGIVAGVTLTMRHRKVNPENQVVVQRRGTKFSLDCFKNSCFITFWHLQPSSPTGDVLLGADASTQPDEAQAAV